MPNEPFIAYRADIDGLRALAVTLVLAFHLNVGFSGGFIGVDVFFVISGFLITRSLLKDQETGGADLAAFWTRRLRRIFPAAAFVTLCCLCLGACLMLPADFCELARSAIWQQAMAANIFFWRSGNYFAENTTKPLLHTWSLAVEEQFYAVYPLLLALPFMSRRRCVPAVLLVLALVSFVLSIIGVARYPGATFFLLPTRAWELLVGGLVAIAPVCGPRRPSFAAALSVAALSMILAPSLFYTGDTPFPGAAALLPCAGTALFIVANEHPGGFSTNAVTQVAACGPVRYIGLISYSLYLWHWPLIVLWSYWFGPPRVWSSQFGLAMASVGLASLTWRYVEQPLRRTRRFLTLRSAAAASLAVTAASIALAWIVVAGDGLPGRVPMRARRYLEVTDADRDAQRYWAGYGASVPGHEARWLEQDPPPGCRADFLLWGDSHAACAADACRRVAAAHGLHGLLVWRPAAVPLVGAWKTNRISAMYHESAEAWSNDVVSTVRDLRIPAVIMFARWDTLADGQITDGNAPASAASAMNDAHDAFRRSLRRTIDALTGAGAHVWLVEPVPTLPVAPIRWCVARAMTGQTPPLGITRSAYDGRARATRVAFRDCEDSATIISLADSFFDDNGVSRVADADHCYYSDDNHLSAEGVDLLMRPLLDRIFADIESARVREGRSP